VTIVTPSQKQIRQTKIYHQLIKDGEEEAPANTFLSNELVLLLDHHCDEIQRETKLVSTPSYLKNQLLIYPNPSADKVGIEWAKEIAIDKVRLYNLAGMLVKEVSVNGNNYAELEVLDDPPGIYFIKASTLDKTVFVERLSVIR